MGGGYGSTMPFVSPVEGLVPAMGSGGVGVVGLSLARSEDAGGSIFVSLPPFSGISIPVISSIGTFADSFS